MRVVGMTCVGIDGNAFNFQQGCGVGSACIDLGSIGGTNDIVSTDMGSTDIDMGGEIDMSGTDMFIGMGSTGVGTCGQHGHRHGRWQH